MIGIFFACVQIEAESQKVLVEPKPSHEEITSCLPTLAGLPPEFRDDERSKSSQLIVVYKRQKLLGRYQDGRLVEGSCWDIALGSNPYEAKIRMDNASTPEGWYDVAYKRTADPLDVYANTVFYKALHVSYPNATDVYYAKRAGIVSEMQAEELLRSIESGQLPSQSSPMGGAILIHGWEDGLSNTLGCVGMRERDMDVLFDAVPSSGTTILILPWHRIIRQDATYKVDTIPKAG